MPGQRWIPRGLLAAATLVLCTACGSEQALSPEAARARGDALLAQMSQNLAGLQAFAYTAEQTVEHVRDGGEKAVERFTRRTIVQRPNRLAFTDAGEGREAAAWYDGTHVTLVSNRDRVWARGPMPGTLDAALDFVSAEYAVQIPTADLLYSKPIDALIGPDTTGGWVGVEKVGDRTCDHLSYHDNVVDWQLWLRQDDRHLPCQLAITYKTAPGQPTTRIVFSQLDASPAIDESTFKAKVPDGFSRIRLMRHATTVDEPAAGNSGAQP